MNPLKELNEFGQSVWLDFIQRKLLTGGELKRMVEEDGLKGVTSNPAIFEKAIADSDDYDDVIAELGGGRIAGIGTHESLMCGSDLYQRLFELQTVGNWSG